MASSAEKRSSGSSDAGQFLISSRTRFQQEKCSSEISIRDPENKSGMSEVFGTNENSSEGPENAGSSGKRKHSRWDSTSQVDEQNVDDGVAVEKQKKTRWDNEDSQLKMLGPINLPCFVTGTTDEPTDPKIMKLKIQLCAINRRLQSQVSVHELERDAQLHEKLLKQKQHIIRHLVRKLPTFVKKLYIPVKEYPEYDFVSHILGRYGKDQKRLEKKTGARIILRGKGAPKRKDAKPDPSDDEDLHVLIEARDQKSFDAAVAIIERLLVPVGKNELEHAQLGELAEQNSTLRGKNSYEVGKIASKTVGKCNVCHNAGHYAVACPFAGRLLQTNVRENDVNFLAAPGRGFSPSTSSLFLENPPIDFRPEVHSMSFGSVKFNRDVDCTNLYVDHLPPHADVSRLVQLFSPFGAVSYVKVMRDEATGLSKGYGFVKYVDPTSAAMAVNQMNGYRLDGNLLVVRVAGNQLGTPGSMHPVEDTRISFPSAYPGSFATAHIPAPTCLPGPPASMLPKTHDLMCASYGSSCTGPIPSSLTSTHNAMSEELARFPGNPDNFASGYPSLFS